MQSHIKLMCFVLGFYEALLGLLNPVNKELRCLDLQFHLEAFEFMMILCSLQFYTFILYRVCIFSFPHLSSLLPFLKTIPEKKESQTSPKKFSKGKQAHVGMERSKTSRTRWERHHNTFTPSLHLVPFCQLYAQQKTLYTLTK